MREYLRKINPVLLDLITGCLIYGIIGEIFILTILPHIYEGRLSEVSVGFLVGVALMVMMSFHMYVGVRNALSMGESGARKHSYKLFAIRIVAVAVVFFILYFTGAGNVVALVIGMLSLKVSAYFQPFTDRFITSKIK